MYLNDLHLFQFYFRSFARWDYRHSFVRIPQTCALERGRPHHHQRALRLHRKLNQSMSAFFCCRRYFVGTKFAKELQLGVERIVWLYTKAPCQQKRGWRMRNFRVDGTRLRVRCGSLHLKGYSLCGARLRK
uniref:(northern house mosquito) hypothetical protein n=1 Tax=Culex pipiens TaxID=7175 RepID=A0A8D8KXC9_CULPI